MTSRVFICLFALAASLGAAVNGTVVNKTNGKPQPGATVTIMQLSEGMKPVGSLQTDASGKFSLAQDVKPPILVQVNYQGVTYNEMVQAPPGAEGIAINVYEASNKPGKAVVSQHVKILEPGSGALTVSENVAFQNTGNTTYFDPRNGTLRLHIPSNVQGDVRVMASTPGGMPIPRTAEKTGEPDIYKVTFPIRPGETRFDVVYQVPFRSPGELSGKFLYKANNRVAVPSGVTVKGENLKAEGTEPQTQASIFTVTAPEYKLTIEGAGALSASRAAPSGQSQSEEDDSRPKIEEMQPRLHRNMAWILGLGFAILALGFVLYYRADGARPTGTGKRG